MQGFDKCSPDHHQDYEYCCLRSKRIFCQNCWFKQAHAYKCYSSKCGHYEKIAYSAISKSLQSKVLQYTSSMCSGQKKFEYSYRSMLRLKQVITDKVKSDIQNKLPLFIWTAYLEMLSSRNSSLMGAGLQDSVCSDLLRIIKGKNREEGEGASSFVILQDVVRCYHRIVHSCQGVENALRDGLFQGNQDQHVEDVVNFCMDEASNFVQQINCSIKTYLEEEVRKLLKSFNPDIKFDSIKFNKKPTFESIERYNKPSLYSAVVDTDIEALYNGIQLKIEKLKETPEILLEVCKSMLKQKIVQLSNNFKQVKPSHPYKYAYIMSTCLQPDPQYQQSILTLQKRSLSQLPSSSSQTCKNPLKISIHLLILGPELIIIEQRPPPRVPLLTIIGYRECRRKYYDLLLKEVGIGSGIEGARVEVMRASMMEMGGVEVGCALFFWAYQYLFGDKQKIHISETQASRQGMRLLQQVCIGWHKYCRIDLGITRNKESYISYLY